MNTNPTLSSQPRPCEEARVSNPVGEKALMDEGIAVKQLLMEVEREVVEQEAKETLLFAVVQWFSALSIFRRVERRAAKAQKTSDEFRTYVALMCLLMGVGEILLVKSKKIDGGFSELGLSAEDLHAHIDELEVDHRAATQETSSEQKAEFAALFDTLEGHAATT